MTARRWTTWTSIPLAVTALVSLGGCNAGMDSKSAWAIESGNYGAARVRLQEALSNDPSDRDYILGRMRLQIATLADGDPHAAEEISNEAYRLLRVQGLNADRTVASVVLNEGVKIWKGEPFEQAMSFSYIAIQKGMLGEWDNMRAAAQSSLFLLKDFGDNEKTGKKLTTEEIARRAAERDRQNKGGDAYLDYGYTPIKTDFELGYVLTGVASLALGRREEASDNLNTAVEYNAGLGPLRDALLAGGYNTIFVVDYGRGPAKVARGDDGALARFEPRWASDGRALSYSVAGGGVEEGTSFSAVTDVNRLAQSHLWNNLEDVRAAKSSIGSLLLAGGAITALSANQGNRDARANQQIIGASLAAAGLLLKATSQADTRHLELLPQRTYIVPVNITSRGSVVTLQVQGDPGSRMVLAAVSPPEDGERLQLRYVRLSNGRGGAPAWATSGRIVYANDATEERVAGDGLPFILGGRCVRTPSAETMARYHGAGNLTNMTASDLENLYREEGITLRWEDNVGRSRKHILEGGDTLVAPEAGTAGYARLFGQEHPAYRPRSKAVRELAEQIAAARGAGPPIGR